MSDGSQNQSDKAEHPQTSRAKETHPHPVANEMSPDSDEDAKEETATQQASTVDSTERAVGSTLLKFALGLIVVGLIVAAIIVQSWAFFVVAIVLFIPMALLFMAPIWLARTTKIAQDQAVRGDKNDQR